MAKVPKDILKKLPDGALLPGESIVTASWFDRPSAGKQAFDALLVGRIPTSGGSSSREGVAGGAFSAMVPGGRVIVALTDRRLLVFGPTGGRKDPLPLAVAYEPEHVAEIIYKMGINASSFRLLFADGSEARFDVPGDNNGKALAKAGAAFCRGRTASA